MQAAAAKGRKVIAVADALEVRRVLATRNDYQCMQVRPPWPHIEFMLDPDIQRFQIFPLDVLSVFAWWMLRSTSDMSDCCAVASWRKYSTHQEKV